MCDVGVKKFTIFFKIKIYKKICKKFCRLQKHLYLCSVNKNKQNTKVMKRYFIRLAFTSICRVEVSRETFNRYYCLNEDSFRYLNNTDVEVMVYPEDLSSNLKKRFKGFV